MITAQQQRVPALRFKDEDGGDYPDWEMKKLDHVGDIVGGGTPSTGKRSLWDGDINWFTPTEIKTKYATGSIRKITREGIAQSSAALLPVGTILFTSRATIGEVSIAREVCTTNQGFQSFIVNDSMFSNEYLYYWLLANKKHFLRRANGSTFLEISKSEIKKIPLCIPAIREQQKIAAFLSAVDIKIEQLSRKQSLLEQYKQGMMQKLFSQEIRFKDEDGRDYPDWEEKSLGDISKISKGKGISKSDVVTNGELKCIRYGELYTHYGTTISLVISSTNIPPSQLELSNKNDVIIPSSGEIASDIATAACVRLDGVALGGDINIIRCQENGVFLAYYLNYKKADIARLAQGISVIHLYASHLRFLKLSIPSKCEQQKIANFLSAIDRKIELVAKQVEQACFFKQGLLQQMFI